MGFGVLAPYYQRQWTRRSHARLRRLLEVGRPVPEPEDRLLHQGPERITNRRDE